MTSLAATALLVLALIPMSLALWLTDRKSRRHLRERVDEAGARGRGRLAPAVAQAPNIRAAGHDGRPLTQRFVRALGINRDIPEERTIPWPLVAIVSASGGVLAWLIAGVYFVQVLSLPLGLFCGLATARGLFFWQHQRYCKALFKQVPDALGMVLRSVRSGLPVAEALRGVASEMSAPTGPQFARIVGEIAIGKSVDSAFLRLYDRTRVTEYGFLSVALGLQSQSGGSLGETLEILADIVRKRVAIAARARALAAESTSSAIILIILPFVCALAMAFIRPGYLSVFWSDPRGFKMMVLGLTLMAVGTVTIWWMIGRATAE